MTTIPIKKEKSDEVDLGELLQNIWRQKIVLLFIISLFALFSIFYSLMLPNQYTSDTVLVGKDSGSSVQLNQGGSMGAFSALMNLGGSSDNPNVTLAKKTLTSKSFVATFIRDNNLLPLIMAAKGWDSKADKIIFDTKAFDPKLSKMRYQPSDEDIYKSFLNRLTIFTERETGYITLGFKFYSPHYAQNILQTLVTEINNTIKNKEVTKAEKAIEYLHLKISQTNASDLRLLFNKLIEENTKVLMLAEIDQYFVLDVVDPPSFSSRKSEPGRATICILGTILGLFFGLFALVVMNFFRLEVNLQLNPPRILITRDEVSI